MSASGTQPNANKCELAQHLALPRTTSEPAGERDENPSLPTRIKLSEISPIDSAARSAERYGNTGSPRTARLAKEIEAAGDWLLNMQEDMRRKK